MNIEVAQQVGTHLSSRDRAAELRAYLADLGLKVTLDFSNVVSVSSSFADELFGVLVLEHGIEWLRDHVDVKGAAPDVLRSLLKAIDRRVSRVA